ncbi:hypothetical protein [Streptomyces sp. H39-S7]|uniref:hypothetical protein n=1 Tax=Streptomyces sp. H39-S7 TaxID=3004357 RepID=UPI0022AFCF2A|nr:hypothetical protein [Streptomyces sp. H39-S7]MCZ4117827.1 hypothetical protein [Streptomyces sp. H39-S7]
MSYSAAHARVRRYFGPASLWPCQWCGLTASDNAYDHTDPSPQISPAGLTYSDDPNRYITLCRSCHQVYDATHAQDSEGFRPAIPRLERAAWDRVSVEKRSVEKRQREAHRRAFLLFHSQKHSK